MEHTDAGVHTVLADVERPAEHEPFADQPDRVLTERPIETTADGLTHPPSGRIGAGPAAPRPTPLGPGLGVGSGRPAEIDASRGAVAGAEHPAGGVITRGQVAEALDEDLEDDLDDDPGDATPDGGVEALDDGQTLAPVIDLGLGDLLGEAMEWQERALCAQTDPEAFFPEKGGSTREAKRICSGCEVRAECLEYALENDERFGIWGGMSERERRKQRRRAV